MKIVILGENSSVHIQKWIAAIAGVPGVELHVITFDRGVKFEGVHYYPLSKITGTKLDYILNIFKVKAYIKKNKTRPVACALCHELRLFSSIFGLSSDDHHRLGRRYFRQSEKLDHEKITDQLLQKSGRHFGFVGDHQNGDEKADG